MLEAKAVVRHFRTSLQLVGTAITHDTSARTRRRLNAIKPRCKGESLAEVGYLKTFYFGAG